MIQIVIRCVHAKGNSFNRIIDNNTIMKIMMIKVIMIVIMI